MCEQFISLVDQDDWVVILQRLGISEDTIERIEDELPGGYNFHQRVTRALEYWSGLELFPGRSNIDVRVTGSGNAEAFASTTAGADDNVVSTTTSIPNTEEVRETSQGPSIVFGDTEADISMVQHVTFHLMPRVMGPKASPERFIHILKLLDKADLLASMTKILEKYYARQL